MSRYKLTISYDGSNFSGWQRQPDARTVEQDLEDAFSRILRKDTDLTGQGRTDAGVHALGQVAHVDLPEDIDTDNLIHRVNGLTSQDILIRSCEKVQDDFHARFDALSRTYQYTLLRVPLPLSRHHGWYPGSSISMSLLKDLTSLVSGTHDFRGFSKIESDEQSTQCRVSECTIREYEDRVVLEITANRFLRHMVRRLAGTMVKVAAGQTDARSFSELLHQTGKPIQAFTAPAHALSLHSVQY